MRAKLVAKLTTTRILVLVIGVLFAFAWAVPSLGASVSKVARTALGRANEAVYHSDVAVSQSNAAKSTASAASSAAKVAGNAANQAQTTANQALSSSIGSAHVADNFTVGSDPGNIAADSCLSDPISRLGVLSTDEVIVTPPSTQPLGIITQASTSSSTITLVFCNVTNAGIDPPSGQYEFSILR